MVFGLRNKKLPNAVKDVAGFNLHVARSASTARRWRGKYKADLRRELYVGLQQKEKKQKKKIE
jgi:hypothetical protein